MDSYLGPACVASGCHFRQHLPPIFTKIFWNISAENLRKMSISGVLRNNGDSHMNDRPSLPPAVDEYIWFTWI